MEEQLAKRKTGVRIPPTQVTISTIPELEEGSVYLYHSGSFEEIEDVTLLRYPRILKLAGGSIVDGISKLATRRSIYPPFVEPVHLTPAEWLLYSALAAQPNEPVAASLCASVIGMKKPADVRVFVARLRRKLGREAVVNVRGAGYELAVLEGED